MKYRLLSSIYYEDRKKYSELYLERVNGESTYNYNFKVGDNEAFFVISNAILSKLDLIRKLDKILTLKIRKLPPIALLQYTKKCLIDEIKMTNDIEGVVSTRKEINEILNDTKTSKENKRLYGLVKKYQMLTKEEVKLNTCRDIRTIYDEMVLKEVIEEENSHEPDGEIFRKDKVYVRNRNGKKIHEGVTPEEKIIELMSESLKILEDDKQNKLVNIAVFHYMFGYIHPFYDGNGRTSRFISSYLLARELEELVSYRISYTIKKNINSYYKSFKLVNDEKNRGDLTSFVDTFFDILIESLEELCESLDDRINKLKYYNECILLIDTLDDREIQVLFILVQNALFGENGIGIIEIYENIDIGDSKLRSIIKKLDEMGLIYTQKDGRKKIYTAELSILNEIYVDYESRK